MTDTSLAGKNILYVEDNEASRHLMEIVFEEMGCSLVAVASAQEALVKIQADKFDLVLTDIRMPQMNGYELARVIRQTDAQVPIYALTAHVMEYVPMKCQDAGMNGFITKPIQIEEFKRTIKTYFGIS